MKHIADAVNGKHPNRECKYRHPATTVTTSRTARQKHSNAISPHIRVRVKVNGYKTTTTAERIPAHFHHAQSFNR